MQETVHGRGYRFVAPVSATMPPERPVMLGRPRRSLPSTVGSPPLFVGRDAELAQIEQWWTMAQQGQRQVGCIVGEPGIGKTALVETFVTQVRATEDVWVGHGQCLDHYGAGEAYLPLLEALGRLCREPAGAPLVAMLRQYAPSWLVHLPVLLASEDRERLEHLVTGTTHSMPSWCSTICQQPRLRHICGSAAGRSPSPQACRSSCTSVQAAIRCSS